MSNRTPLMAGNWKMNLDHLEANHLVQGLPWSSRTATTTTPSARSS